MNSAIRTAVIQRAWALMGFCALGFFALSIMGCSPAVDPKVQELRKKFVLDSEPADASTIESAIAAVANQPQVTLVGRINAGSSNPFGDGVATLVLSESPEPGHNHDPGDCPFCKRRMENAKSCIVRFLDEKGEVLTYGPEKLLGVSKDQDVVVKGEGKFLADLDLLQVDASGIFVRPPSKGE